MQRPLDGVRIIDWTIWQQGPVSTMMLGDLGAEVIKIEERVGGDPGRGIMTAAGEPNMPPLNITGGIADQMGAIMLAYGIMAALLARHKYGIGQEVDTSHLGSMTALQGLNVSCMTILGTEFKRMPRAAAP